MTNYPGGRIYKQPTLPSAPMVVTKRTVGGLKAKKNGQRFEALIERACSYYRKTGVAHIQKIPEPMRVVKPIKYEKGMFKAHFEKQAQPDFNGSLKGGKMIVFEAKHESGKSIKKNRLTIEQVYNFEVYQRLGVMCFILVSFNMKNFYRVPWDFWINSKHKKKSFSEKELEEFEVDYDGRLLNFLEKKAK